jgi:hypothetical protein
MLLRTAVFLVVFSTLLIPDQTSLMQLIVSASFFKHYVTLIGLLSSAFCATFDTLLLMDYIFVPHHLARFLHFLMQTRLTVQITGDPRGICCPLWSQIDRLDCSQTSYNFLQ